MNLTFTSERLLLRPLAASDLDVAVEILTDPEVMRYAGGAETRDKVIEHMPISIRRCAGGCVGVWCVIDRATEEKLGTGVLLPLPIEQDDTDWELVVGDALPAGEIEVGYLLKRSAWGRGFATEVCTRLLRFAFEDSPLEEVVAVTDPDNTASQNVLLKSGLVAEGMRRCYAHEAPGFRITRAEWLARR